MQEGKSMEWFEYGSPDARIVLLQPVGEHDLGAAEREFAIIQESAAVEFTVTDDMLTYWSSAENAYVLEESDFDLYLTNGNDQTLHGEFSVK